MEMLFSRYSATLTALWFILITVLLQSLIATLAHRRQAHYVPGILDPELGHRSFVFRSHRTFMNSLENLPMLVLPAMIGILSGMNPDWLSGLCWLYAASRVGHMALFYIIATEKNPSPRSYFYSLGLLASVILNGMLGWHLLLR